MNRAPALGIAATVVASLLAASTPTAKPGPARITYCPARLEVVATGRWLAPAPPLADALVSYAAGIQGNQCPRVPGQLSDDPTLLYFGQPLH